MARQRAINFPAEWRRDGTRSNNKAQVVVAERRGSDMRWAALELRPDEEAMLVLMSMEPLSEMPALHVKTARRLADLGLAISCDGLWYPTGRGLERLGYSVH